MRKFLFSVLACSFLTTFAFAAGKTTAKPAAKTGISEATVNAAVKEFIEALASLDDDRVLASVAAADRGALKGRENLIGTVFPRKMTTPKVSSFEKVDVGGKTIGAIAKVTVQETDPIDGMASPKERSWFLALDGNVLKVSVSSLWLDAEMVKEP